MSDDQSEIAEWLRRLKWSLAPMPSPEREEIVEETRAHLREAVAGGKTPAEALAGFDAPEEYARRFLDGMEVSGALGSQATGAMLSAVGRRAHRSLVAAVAGFGVFLLGTLALAAVVITIYKIGDPVHAGLWLGPHEFFLGMIDDPSQARELIGNGIYLLGPLIVAAAWFLGRFLLLWALRVLARTR